MCHRVHREREREHKQRGVFLIWLCINFDNSLNLWKSTFFLGCGCCLDLDLGLDFVSGSVWKRSNKERWRARRSFVSFQVKGKGSCRKRQAFLRGVACWVSTLRKRVPLEISASAWLATSNPTVRLFFGFWGYSLNFWYFGCEKRERGVRRFLMFQTGVVFSFGDSVKWKWKRNTILTKVK